MPIFYTTFCAVFLMTSEYDAGLFYLHINERATVCLLWVEGFTSSLRCAERCAFVLLLIKIIALFAIIVIAYLLDMLLVKLII